MYRLAEDAEVVRSWPANSQSAVAKEAAGKIFVALLGRFAGYLGPLIGRELFGTSLSTLKSPSLRILGPLCSSLRTRNNLTLSGQARRQPLHEERRIGLPNIHVGRIYVQDPIYLRDISQDLLQVLLIGCGTF
jgi:hypothetical protein